MARLIGVPSRTVNEIVLWRLSITPAMFIRFGVFFGKSEGVWHQLQVECDFWHLPRIGKNSLPGCVSQRRWLRIDLFCVRSIDRCIGLREDFRRETNLSFVGGAVGVRRCGDSGGGATEYCVDHGR